MYKFRLSIGDWSGDGHGDSEDFVVSSNVPVTTVREAHFRIKETTGVDIEDVCSDYGEDEIEEDTIQALKKLGFKFDDSTGMGEGFLYPAEMAKLWLFLLQKKPIQIFN